MRSGATAWIGWGAPVAVSLIVVALAAPAAAAPPRVSRELRAATAPGPELRTAGHTALPGDAVVYRFQQRVGGLRVLGSQAVVYRAPGGAPSSRSGTRRPMPRSRSRRSTRGRGS